VDAATEQIRRPRFDDRLDRPLRPDRRVAGTPPTGDSGRWDAAGRPDTGGHTGQVDAPDGRRPGRDAEPERPWRAFDDATEVIPWPRQGQQKTSWATYRRQSEGDS
jgi:hypothetical protein